MLTKLKLHRFRSFPSSTAKFANPTFLAGRNGSGKSNLVDAFAFLAELWSRRSGRFSTAAAAFPRWPTGVRRESAPPTSDSGWRSRARSFARSTPSRCAPGEATDSWFVASSASRSRSRTRKSGSIAAPRDSAATFRRFSRRPTRRRSPCPSWEVISGSGASCGSSPESARTGSNRPRFGKCRPRTPETDCARQEATRRASSAKSRANRPTTGRRSRSCCRASFPGSPR